MNQLELEAIVVHCIFCPATVEAYDPATAHDLMEDHYRHRHAATIGRIIGAS